MGEERKSILVWGTHGVGKTSMINSLPHELEKLSREDELILNLTVPLEDNESGRGMRFRTRYEKLGPTQFHDPVSWDLNIVPVKDPQSAKKYNLIFVDDKGDEMWAAVDKTSDVSPNNNLIRNYLERQSKGVIALFEYNEILLNDSKLKYENADLLISLIDVLASREDEVSLAICINKIDRTRQRWKDPKVFFEIVFENNWTTILSVVRASKNKKLKIGFFVTSMVGYVRNMQGDTVPNFSADDVIDGDILRPWNVAAPIFWMLGSIEGSSTSNNWFVNYFSPDDKKNIVFPQPFF